jgi:hypothetical protein
LDASTATRDSHIPFQKSGAHVALVEYTQNTHQNQKWIRGALDAVGATA